jgi:hypothetical protein
MLVTPVTSSRFPLKPLPTRLCSYTDYTPLHAGSTCFTSIQPVDGLRESNDILAGRHATGNKGRQMVWLEIRNERAHVMVDNARYNDWKKKHSMKDVERSQHGL